MKLLRHCIFILMYTLMFASCTQNDSDLSSLSEWKLSIQLQLGQPTRATIDGVDDLNENKVSTIDLFLFQDDADENDVPIYSCNISESSITFDSHDKTASFDFDISAFHYNTLFSGDKTTCKAYAIVNRPADCSLPAHENCSLSALKHLVISSSHFQITDDKTKTGKNILTKQPLFVMDGFADNITRSAEKQLSGIIPVKRAAVKIQLLLDEITDHIPDNGTNWTADKENVRITLRNGCNRSYLNEETPASYLKPNKDTDLFSLENITLDVLDGENNLTTSFPMYTYPTYWGNDNASHTYIVLMIDWINDDDNSEKITTYYEIPVNAAGDYLVRNSFYKITQTVNIIGSESEEEAIELYPSSYVVLDWGATKVGTEDTETDAEISKLKYLVMDESSVVMQNTSQRELLYFSSDPIEIRNLVIQKMDVSGNVAETEPLFSSDDLSSCYNAETKTYTITETGLTKPVYLELHSADPNIANDHDYILLKHDLDNNMGKDSDYTEYIFTFDVVHVGDDANKLSESVEVEQYPMIAIKADLNSDYNNDSDINGNKGFVYLNNSQRGNNPYGVSGMNNSASNANPNRYIISVSSLTEDGGNEYIIGDPRSKNTYIPNNLNRDANSRSLTYYYPTDDSNATKEMISPQFMIASSYGVTSSMSKNNAKNRCAAYQEDGYPAGRWRIPTRAEMKYIIQLSEWGVIPTLFNPNANYWSAHGAVQYTTNNGFQNSNETSAFIRCVYDTWYWGTEQLDDKTKFIYGDKER